MKKYLINLDERPDRLDTVTRELNDNGIRNWIRFPAIRTPNGRHGCRLSHLSVMNMAPRKGTFAVMEDDVLFCDGWKHILMEAMRQLPNDWDALWLGSTLTKDLEFYSKNLYRLKGGLTTHFMLFNNRNGIVDYILNNHEEAYQVDVFYADIIQEKFNCFVVYPMAVTQRPGISNIINKYTDYKVITDYYKKHTR